MTGHRVLRSAAVVSAGTALSRVLGLVREMLMAYYFGTSLAKSAFDVAFRFPNLFRRLFGEGALSAAFIPVFTRTLEEDGQAGADRLAGRTLTLLATVLGMVVVGGLVLTTVALSTMSLGERAAAVLPLLRIMLPYLLFICVAAFCMALLNSMRHFALPALTPVVLNLVWIGVLLWICPRFGDTPGTRITGVAWGILAAGAIQLAIQAPLLYRFGFRLPAAFGRGDPRVRHMLVLMGPAALGMGIHQLNLCVDGILALWAAPWAPAALTFAERLVYLPLGVFATAFGTVLLPTFSRQAVAENPDAMLATLQRSTRVLMLVMVPAAVGLMVLARPIVELLYAWRGGEFTAASSLLTARALVFYGPGLIVFSLAKLLVPVFYAVEDTRTPVRVGIAVVILNVVLNVTSVLALPTTYRHAGMAMATVICSGVNGLVLGRLLTRRFGSPGWGIIAGTTVRACLAAGAMGAVAAGAHRGVATLLADVAAPAKLVDLAALAAAIAAGIVTYGILVVCLCRNELRDLKRGG